MIPGWHQQASKSPLHRDSYTNKSVFVRMAHFTLLALALPILDAGFQHPGIAISTIYTSPVLSMTQGSSTTIAVSGG